MLTVNVLLSGRLRLDGYGRGRQASGDGTYPLALEDGSTIREVMCGMTVPADRVTMTMLNGRRCSPDARLGSGDRVILIPEDVAALWSALGRQDLGMGIGSDA